MPLKDGKAFTPDEPFVVEAVTEGGGLLGSGVTIEKKKPIAFQTHFIDSLLPSVQCNARFEVPSTEE